MQSFFKRQYDERMLVYTSEYPGFPIKYSSKLVSNYLKELALEYWVFLW